MIVIIESRGSLDITHSTFRITAHQESNVIVIFVIFNIQCCVYPPNLAVMAMRHLAKEMHDNQCHCWSLDHNLLFDHWGLRKKNNSPGVPSNSRICNLFTIDAVGYRDDNEERPDIWQSLPENQWIMGSESSLGFLPKPFGIFLVCNLHWCCFRANITPYCKPPLYFIQT